MRDILLLSLVACLAGAEPADGGRRLTVADLQSATVIGRLGVRLGVVCEIEAEIVDGDSTHRMDDAGAYLLRVRGVDGKQVADGPLMHFAVLPGGGSKLDADHLDRQRRLQRAADGHAADDHDPPSDAGYVGTSHQLLVYEEGGFSGIPEGLPQELAWQDHGFVFTTRLVVVRQHDATP